MRDVTFNPYKAITVGSNGHKLCIAVEFCDDFCVAIFYHNHFSVGLKSFHVIGVIKIEATRVIKSLSWQPQHFFVEMQIKIPRVVCIHLQCFCA